MTWSWGSFMIGFVAWPILAFACLVAPYFWRATTATRFRFSATWQEFGRIGKSRSWAWNPWWTIRYWCSQFGERESTIVSLRFGSGGNYQLGTFGRAILTVVDRGFTQEELDRSLECHPDTFAYNTPPGETDG